MKFIKCLGSGSSGNCFILDNKLILDAGLSFKKIKDGISYDNLANIEACLVTHCHGDHSKSVHKLASYQTKIYGTKGTNDALKFDLHEYIQKNFIDMTYYQLYETESYYIIAFEAVHDCIEPSGFLIQEKSTGEVLLFATDTAVIKAKAKRIDFMLVEANYRDAELFKNYESGIIDKARLTRVMDTHLSFEGLQKYLRVARTPHLKKIMLMHLSNENSNEREFVEELENEFFIDTIGMAKNKIVRLGRDW